MTKKSLRKAKTIRFTKHLIKMLSMEDNWVEKHGYGFKSFSINHSRRFTAKEGREILKLNLKKLGLQ